MDSAAANEKKRPATNAFPNGLVFTPDEAADLQYHLTECLKLVAKKRKYAADLAAMFPFSDTEEVPMTQKPKSPEPVDEVIRNQLG